MLVSIVVRAYGWIVILGDTGVINRMLLATGFVDAPLHMMYTDGAMLLGFVYVEFPFMVLAMLASLERIPREALEAARTLGASPLRVTTNIVLPLAAPGIIAGATIVFSLCMTAFVTPLLMGGNGAKVLTTLIYQQFVVSFNWPLGAVAAVILLVLSLGFVASFTWSTNRASRPSAAR
jgi:putative spermidine/putrescine transport system permease protein